MLSRFTGFRAALLASVFVVGDRGGDLSARERAAPFDVCGSPIGTYGDATGDAVVNIIDAQQIARFSVGLSVANMAAMMIGGDVDGSGAINVIDAQQIARYSVALPLGAGATARVNTPACAVQSASLSLSTIGISDENAVAGTSVTLTLTARDGAGAQLPHGGLLVVFTKGAGTSDGTISSTNDAGNGTYTATFSATTPGSPRAIGATIGGAPVTSASPTISVTAGPVSTVWSTLSALPGSVQAGGTVNLLLTARDGLANVLTTGGLSVTFIKGSGTSDGNISAVSDAGNGTYSATFTATTVGTPRTIGAAIGGVAISSALPTVSVTPGAVSTLQSTVTVTNGSILSGAVTTLIMTARDAGGAQQTTGGLVVAFTKGAGTSDGNISSVTDNGNGTYSAAFTGTTSGNARTIGATIGGVAVSSALPTVTVSPGAASPLTSVVSVSQSSVATGGTSTLTLTTRDAAGNLRIAGGSVVVFTKGSGTSDGTIAPATATDNGNGTYTATFTATTAGTARTIGATIGGSAVSTALPTITVTLPTMALATDSVTINAQVGTVSPSQLVAVASTAGGAVSGLSTTNTSLTSGSCTTVAWLQTPTFDMSGIANPVSLMTLTGDATSLPLGTCVRQVTVTSTTPGVASKTLVVILNVGRAPAAQGIVDVVMMGNAGGNQNVPQVILPIPTIELANGGRGTITNLAATVTAVSGYRDCPQFPDDPSVCHLWLRNSDLTFSSSQMPSVLSIASQINPFGGTATVSVTGTGMPTPLTFNIVVNFNTQGELVTNPRGMVLRGVAKGATVSDSVMAFNQNTANQPLTNIRLDPTNTFPTWLTQTVTHPFTDSTRIKLTANPNVGASNTPGTLLTFGVKVLADWNDEFQGLITKSYTLPVTFIVEGGLSLSLADATLFGAFNGASATQDIRVNNNGAGELSSLTKSVAGGAPWLTASFVSGATNTPATLHLVANPTGMAKGTYNTTVTVTSGSGATLQTRTIPVHFTIF